MGTLDRLIAGALRRRFLVLVGVVILVAMGAWSVLRIPIDAFPDVTNIQVELLSTAPGMSPPEVERFVTYPGRDRHARAAAAHPGPFRIEIGPLGGHRHL